MKSAGTTKNYNEEREEHHELASLLVELYQFSYIQGMHLLLDRFTSLPPLSLFSTRTSFSFPLIYYLSSPYPFASHLPFLLSLQENTCLGVDEIAMIQPAYQSKLLCVMKCISSYPFSHLGYYIYILCCICFFFLFYHL